MNSKAPDILKRSPHDLQPAPAEHQESQVNQTWVASRYNARANTEDGRLILWNTFRGSLSVFQAEQAQQVVALLTRNGIETRAEGLAKYLIDRGFLVKKGTNEYRQFQLVFGQQQYRSDTLQLILLSSEDCNFRCKYCYEKFARGTMRPEVRQGIKRLVEKRLPTLRSLSTSWFGGEPLYGWAAIEELGPFFAETARKHGISYSSSMTTNGYLLTPDLVDKLFSWGIKRYQITLDGPPEHHDCSRPTRDGRGSFWTIVHNLRELARRQEDFNVTLRVNFDQKNHRDMDKLFDIVQNELRADSRFRFSFHAVGRWGGDNDAQLEVCGSGGQDIVTQLKAVAHARGFNVGTLRDFNYPGAQVCYAARPYNFIIGATGKVMKCTVSLETDDKNTVGHLTPEGELKLDADKMALWTEPAFAGDKQCQRCVMLPTCQGSYCPLVRMEEHRSPCTPTRRHFKQQLREAADYHGNRSRTREVPAKPR